MKPIRFLAIVLILLQIVIVGVVVFEINSISKLHGAGRAQSEMVLIGPFIISFGIAAIGAILLIIELLKYAFKFGNRMDDTSLLLFFIDFFSPFLIFVFAMSLL